MRRMIVVLVVLFGVSVPQGEGACRRSKAVYRAFLAQTGYPHGRPGYVVDHIVPLACGGADTVGNMQWQTRAAAQAKDRIERQGCQGCGGGKE
jgi:hypothetical protein